MEWAGEGMSDEVIESFNGALSNSEDAVVVSSRAPGAVQTARRVNTPRGITSVQICRPPTEQFGRLVPTADPERCSCLDMPSLLKLSDGYV